MYRDNTHSQLIDSGGSAYDILDGMSMNVKIEVDERTADVLQARATELGVTVSELLAELATLDSDPVVVESDQIAELDRRWKKIEAGAPQSHTSASSGGCARGLAALPPVASSIDRLQHISKTEVGRGRLQ